MHAEQSRAKQRHRQQSGERKRNLGRFRCREGRGGGRMNVLLPRALYETLVLSSVVIIVGRMGSFYPFHNKTAEREKDLQE